MGRSSAVKMSRTLFGRVGVAIHSDTPKRQGLGALRCRAEFVALNAFDLPIFPSSSHLSIPYEYYFYGKMGRWYVI